MGEQVLRPLRPGDGAAWFAYLRDPVVTEHTSWPVLGPDDIESLVGRLIADYATGASCRWAIAHGRDGALIGTCGFNTWTAAHRRAELAYDLAPGWWGRGVMRSAVIAAVQWGFTSGGLERIEAFVMTTNVRSIAVLERCGFTREGLLRRYRVARGEARDFYVYAVLREAPARSAPGEPGR